LKKRDNRRVVSDVGTAGRPRKVDDDAAGRSESTQTRVSPVNNARVAGPAIPDCPDQDRDRSHRPPSGPRSVGDVMSGASPTVRPESSIKEIALAMAGSSANSVPVVDSSSRLIGVVTERDILFRACSGDKSIEDLRASDAMNPDATGLTSIHSLSTALSTMTRLHRLELPVVDADLRVVGMISVRDIARRGDPDVDLRAAIAASAGNPAEPPWDRQKI